MAGNCHFELKKDKDFNIQIRENYISVYCLMRQFMKIKFKKNAFVGEIHRKYIPFEPLKKEYLKLRLNNEVSLEDKYEPILIIKDLLGGDNPNLIKKEIKKYAGEEKLYQSKLIEKNKKTILDAEIAMTGEEDENTQIDLMYYNKYLNKLVAVEVKLIGDPRLYSEEIIIQLENYHKFMKKNASNIGEAYQNVIHVKNILGLLDDDTLIELVNKNIEVENRILLCIIGYNQLMINIFKDKRLKEIVKPDVMLGVYFFGKNGGDLNFPKGANKELFK